jgi:hypothetical protein
LRSTDFASTYKSTPPLIDLGAPRLWIFLSSVQEIVHNNGLDVMKRSSLLRAILWTIACLAVGYLVWRLVAADPQNSTGPRSPESLSQEAAELNRGLPSMIDKETELMVTETAPGMFIYQYRLVNVSVDGADGQEFAARAKPQLVQMSCSRLETRRDFLSRGVTMRFSYFDKDKRHIATVDVTPADCGL